MGQKISEVSPVLDFTVLDVETCGLVDAGFSRVVEVSAVRFRWGRVQERFTSLVRPEIPIPALASAIHGLTDADVLGAPTPFQVGWDLTEFLLGTRYLIAHQALYDSKFVDWLGVDWICSLRLARRLWPEAPSHGNQALRHWLGLDHPMLRGGAPHRAEYDAISTGLIVCRALDVLANRGTPIESLAAMKEFADGPIPVSLMPFGRHRGQPLGEVPLDYLLWLLRAARGSDSSRRVGLDRDTLASIRAEVIFRADPSAA